MTEIPRIGWSESEQWAVREQLDRILRSGPFQQSRRRQRFLEYIVCETLAGRSERIKGYNIAVEAFDRSEGFDASADPIVRVEAARLRDRLREYYETEGREDRIRIDLPKGAYAPLIEFRDGANPDPAPEQPIRKPPDPWPPVLTISEGASRILALCRVKSRPRPLAGIAAALLVVLTGFSAWLVGHGSSPPAEHAAGHEALDVSSIPSIAVLPFVNLSGDPTQEYFSDGLTEDILTELARSRDLRVIARNTTFQFKGKAVDVGKLGRDLKVRYLIEGSVRRTGDRLRVTAQLVDTETGTQVWANRFDRAMADVVLVQDEIVSQIVGKIAGGYGVIENTEAKSASRKSPAEIQAYDLVLRAREVIAWDWTSDAFRTARETLNQAIALDPSNAPARRQLAWLSMLGWVFKIDDKPVPALDILMQATKAAQLDPADARARMVAASAYFFTKQLDLFRHEADETLALAPYDAEIIATLACMMSSSGDRERGVALAKKANALNAEAAIGWYHSTVYTADYLAGNYEHALEVARQNKQQGVFYNYIEIIPIYGQLGHKQEALDAWRKLRELVPDASAETFESWWQLWNINDKEVARLMDGVYKSGVLSADAKSGQYPSGRRRGA